MNNSSLKQALGTSGRETALRLLVQTPPSIPVLLSLLSEVMDAAIDSSYSPTIALAREVLSKYQTEPEVRSNIQLIASGYLATQDEWHYRRIAELYGLLSYDKELADFLRLCKTSTNVEIQEISNDFHNH